jgi:hypothetical protein
MDIICNQKIKVVPSSNRRCYTVIGDQKTSRPILISHSKKKTQFAE